MKTVEEQLDYLFHSRQGLSYREIARKTGSDRRTVKKYVEEPARVGQPRVSVSRGSKVDGYRDQIAAYLQEDPDYRASWIYDRLRAQGYSGGYELVKRVVRALKAERGRLAYVRFETEPGQQAQVDFGEFVVEHADGTTTKYYLFCLILGYSRMLYAELLSRCDLPSFLDAHQRAFHALGGVPREVLYDRMRNVFLRDLAGRGGAQFTQGLMTLATHYGFVPRVAPAYAPWVKGKVERPMDFVRESFWRGYGFTDLEAANRDLSLWLAQKAERVHGTTRERVDARFERETPHLLALPPHPCDVSERLSRQVRKDCTISVDGNRFVVPHTLVGETILGRLKEGRLRLFADDRLVVEYAVPEGKGHLVQDPRFYAALRADKEQQERKFGRAGKRKPKGRAKRVTIPPTISPQKSRYLVEVAPVSAPYPLSVEHRPLAVYAKIGGDVVTTEEVAAWPTN